MNTLELAPGFYQMTLRYTNMYLIAEKSLTLIDTGFQGTAPHILDFIRKLGRSPEEIQTIILTHNHLDHTGGLEELRKATKAKVLAHRADVFIPENIIPYPAGNVVGVLLRAPGLSSLRRKFVLDSREVDVALEGGEMFETLGGMKIMPTPGHTPGSISLYFPTYKLLVVGDALNKRGDNIRMPLKTVSSDLKTAAESIRLMASLDVEILSVGHGRPMLKDAHVNLKRLVDKIH